MRVLVNDGGRHAQRTGYARVARSVIGALSSSSEVECTVTDPGEFPRMPSVAYAGDADNNGYDVVLQVGQPASIRAQAMPSAAFTMADTRGIPRNWSERLAAVDFLLTPSAGSMDALARVGPPVFEVPLYVDLNRFSPEPRWRAEGPDKLHLITVGTWSFRKGVDLLVKAFLEAFSVQEARLTIISTETEPDRTFNGILETMSRVNRTGDICLRTKFVEDDWLARLYGQADAYVTLTRGEGWGYPAMEAAACGLLPVIAPRGCSIQSFIAPEAFLAVDASSVLTTEAELPFGAQWRKSYADPGISFLEADVASAIDVLRTARVNRSTLAELGREGRRFLENNYTQQMFSDRLVSALTSGLSDAGTPKPVSGGGPPKKNSSASDVVPANIQTQLEARKLEIAAGDKPQPGYLHHDIRPLAHIDIVCDARHFPAEHKESFDEVYASNILEHFNRFEVKEVLLEWVSLLKIGGLMRIIVPDVAEICRQYVQGNIDHEFFVYLMFGGQDYEFNRHFYGFDPGALQGLFESCGLDVVDLKPGKSWENRTVDRYCPMIQILGARRL